jgi:hypothetical protein
MNCIPCLAPCVLHCCYFTHPSNVDGAITDADGYVIPNLPTQDNDVTETTVPKEKDPEPLQVHIGMLF